MIDTITFHALPEAVRAAVAARTGSVARVEPVNAGRNSAIAARLHTATGTVFVKGMPAGHRQLHTQAAEALINPYVQPVAPRLLWHLQVDGWDLLGYENVDGHHADLSPGSRDLPKVADALQQLATIPAPDLPLRRLQDRWATYARDDELEELTGDRLLHTDLNPGNILVDERVHLVDWAWPTLGPAWADPACLALWLIAEGHTPMQAETWAGQLPAWQTASALALNGFTAISARMWQAIAEADHQAWKQQLAAAAQEWREYRSR